jgi:hypothetical protein
LNGKGEKLTLQGSHYIGEFKNNMKHGKGKEETIEHIYEGDYLYDKKEGIGKLKYKGISDCYQGHFKDNSITGTGLYKWSNDDTFEGTFLNGKMHGKGIYRWPDGGEYEGEYVNNLKEGYGVFKWSNGKIYKGYFAKGKPHGNGIMFIENDKYDVEFKEGKLVKSEKLIDLSEKYDKSSKNDTKYKTKNKNSFKNLLNIYPSPTPTSCNSERKKTSPTESKNESVMIKKKI